MAFSTKQLIDLIGYRGTIDEQFLLSYERTRLPVALDAIGARGMGRGSSVIRELEVK